MRYFKYNNTAKNANRALREHYKILTADEKRTIRKEKAWRRISTIMTAIVFFFFEFAAIFAVKLIPQPDWWLWSLFVIIGKVAIGVLLTCISGLLTAGLTNPMWKKVQSFHLPTMRKEVFSKACAHLRNFYGLNEPCIVTKCFVATDEKFKNHDVCLFVSGNELRVTADLIRGFLHGERDLGCYAFERNEIKLSKHQNGKQLMVELKTDNAGFLLGYRAKGFIEKNFIDKEYK